VSDQPAADVRTSARLLVAWVGEDEQLEHVLRAALELARANGARVILYDHDAASTFSDPLPNQWASQGEGEQFGDPLSDEELVKLGFEPFARTVAKARADGVDAWGWLATRHGTDELVDYARRHGADLLLLPAELDEPGLADRLKSETAAKAVDEAEATGGGLAVLLVGRDGGASLAAGRL
jgi:nucleotide-binding universal stress UspA family protein